MVAGIEVCINTFRILCLDGGGIMGAFTAAVLRQRTAALPGLSVGWRLHRAAAELSHSAAALGRSWRVRTARYSRYTIDPGKSDGTVGAEATFAGHQHKGRPLCRGGPIPGNDVCTMKRRISSE
jgi:hypothetical protein